VRSLNRQTASVAALVFVAVLIAAGGFLTVVKPQQTKVRSLDAQIAAAQAQSAALHRAGSRVPQLRTAELFQLSRAMPDDDDMPGILFELSRLADAASVSLVAIQASPRVALPDGSSALPLRVTVDGRWIDVAAFLRRVREQVQRTTHGFSVAGRLFDIDDIQMQPGQEATGPQSTIEAQLTMNAFDYGAPPSPTATAGAAGAGTTGTTTTTTTTSPSSGSQQTSGTGSTS
jgi:Tfp pilus assembly protein PilO